VRLLDSAAPPHVVGLDVRRPPRLDDRVVFRPLDLTGARAAEELAEMLRKERVEALVHLAFRTTPTASVDYDHALETTGSAYVLQACAAAGVRRLVFGSSTMVYGPRPTNPNFLDESSALNGHPDAHCVNNRVEAEGLLAFWRQHHPEVEVSVIRSGWVVGPSARGPLTRHFDRSVVPVPLGYDPLLQVVHEEDHVNVFVRAVLESHPGVYNAVARGVLPLSMLIALAGKRALPLPTPVLHRSGWLAGSVRTGDRPAAFFDYLRYLWVAAGERGWRAFGEPVYSTKEAWMSFVSSRRMRRYR